VILPTETVYGLAADAANAEAVARLYEAKGRPRFNPLIAHVADAAAAARLADFDDRARRLAEVFWPGPLTLVLPFREGAEVADLARAGLNTVAVRVPAHPAARAVLAAFGGPVVAPSANRSGRPSPTSFADAVEETGAAAALAIDGGPCDVGLESTVVALLDGPARLLRRRTRSARPAAWRSTTPRTRPCGWKPRARPRERCSSPSGPRPPAT
jgi:L-threonylcarbamoyladenylate synthase